MLHKLATDPDASILLKGRIVEIVVGGVLVFVSKQYVYNISTKKLALLMSEGVKEKFLNKFISQLEDYV